MMQFGISTYSVDSAIAKGQLDVPGALRFIAAQGADCVELVPFSYHFVKEDGSFDQELMEKTRRTAKEVGLSLANYSILADFCKPDEREFAHEIARVKRNVDFAAQMEIPRMRHDLSGFRRPRGFNAITEFDQMLPLMVQAAREISEYAQTKGVMTLVENHGFFANGVDRVRRILHGVSHENYGLVYDVGNIICVDEDALATAKQLPSLAKVVHLKDFYVREDDPGDSTEFDCGGHWFRSQGEKYLRGSILGQGDLKIPQIVKEIKKAGFDGPMIIEFEGLEDPLYASKVSLDNARRIWENS